MSHRLTETLPHREANRTDLAAALNAISVQNVGKQLRRSHSHQATTLQEKIVQVLQGRRSTTEMFWSLQSVSFVVRQGTTLGLIGRNGAGKSTLMRLMGGVGRPTTGTITVQGRVGALLDLGAGFHPDLTGRENVYINGTISGLTRQQIAQRFQSIVEFAELEEFIDAPLRTYSSGMQMRLGFAIVAHTEPDILLIDEVLAVGDAAFQEKCLRWIEQFKRSGRTIVLVSHDATLVRDFCDSVLWLQKGEVVACGSADVVVRQYLDTMLRSKTGSSLGVDSAARQSGTGEMAITEVRLLNAQRQPVCEVQAGASVSIEISWHAPEPVPSPLFGIAITRPDGFVCYETSTGRGEAVLPTAHGNGTTCLHLERLDLAAGNYLIDTGVYAAGWAGTYHDICGVQAFTVTSRNPNENGILHAPHQWSAHSADRATAPTCDDCAVV